MGEDARFEDARPDAPLALRAFDGDDVPVISALIQDAVFPATEMTWDRTARRFGVLINRFRWEDKHATPPERVQSVLTIDDVQAVASQGIDRRNGDLVLSLLAIEWQAGPDGTGKVMLVLAGDGAISITVEALEITLKDVTKPYLAPSRRAPSHPDIAQS